MPVETAKSFPPDGAVLIIRPKEALDDENLTAAKNDAVETEPKATEIVVAKYSALAAVQVIPAFPP